ncbi:MAG TPA: methyl-accepting chemotaxis protein [Clostridium sp.]
MKGSKGIGTRLYLLIGFVIIFVFSITTFSWITFKSFNENYKSRLLRTSEYINLVDESRQAQVDFKKQVQEWKDMLLRGYDNESFKKYYSQFTQEKDNVQSQLLKLKENMKNQGMDTSSIDTLLNTHKDLYDKYNTAIKSYDPNNAESYRIVDGLVKGIDRKPTDDMDALVKDIKDKSKLETDNMLNESNIDSNNFNKTLICIAVLGVILILFFAFLITSTYKDITTFINQFKTLMKQAESGDLTINGIVHKNDELGQLTEGFNRFIFKIRTLISESKEATTTVVSSSNEVMNTSDEVSKTTEDIASTISTIAENALTEAKLAVEINNAVKDVVNGINRITANSMYITELANNAMGTVTNGSESLKHQIETMSTTKNASENVSEVISDLATKSNEIGIVVDFISGITEQINLLALNASIEAARAGEAGKGFTVVANEVNKLAALSKESTEKISHLIGQVQTHISNAVVQVTKTNDSIDDQVISLHDTNESLNLVYKSVFEVTNKINEVAAETKEINKKIISVEHSTNNISTLIDDNALNTQEISSATEEHTASIKEIASSMNILVALSNNLQNTLSKFES